MWCPDTSDILASIQTAALIHHSPFHLPETLLILLSSSTMKSHSQSVPEVYTHFMHYCAEGLVCIDCFWTMLHFQFELRGTRMITYVFWPDRFSISSVTAVIAGSLLELCVLDPKCKHPVVPKVCPFLIERVLHVMNLGSSQYLPGVFLAGSSLEGLM